SFNRVGQTASESKNNVYVLEQVDDALTIAGRIEGLAPGESIQSARFIGERGFLVTFVQIDPLFTLDLSDPRNPQVVGELKVPGFSTFITPMGDNHLLTIGRDTNDEFGFVRADGVRLSIFDVTDFANPQLAHVEVIGTNGAFSEALFNPKAFTYFAERNLLAFPVEIYGLGGGFGIPTEPFFDDFDGEDGAVGEDSVAAGDEGDNKGEGGTDDGGVPVDVIDLPSVPSDFFSGIYVYEVTPDGGFANLGRISTQPEDGSFYGNTFSRGAFIGDFVYATTSEGVQAAPVGNVESIVSKVDFPAPDFEQEFGGLDDFPVDSFDSVDVDLPIE
ncbi:MAG: hypothetical protein GXP29_10325, partial [Planctomycetes bacterium]|nr:hypothetical protein [Planctomycetota bacterium]